jgi:TonB-dependent receptor
MNRISFAYTALLVVLFVPAIAFGQATLKGVVTDASTNEPMIGVNVVIQGTSLGAATTIDGAYKVTGIPEKLMNVKISCIGYDPIVRAVDFSKNSTVTLNVQLKPGVIQGEEVIVTAQRRGQVAAINQQLTSEAMINAVSAEKIQQIPDVNAAEAIGRLSGIAMSRDGGEGAGVSIRGLSPKYSKITINGVTLPSTNDVNRSTDLSMIAPENVAGIEVFKAITPDMDADAISGTVNLTLAKASPGQNQTVRMYGAYSAMPDDWKQYKGFIRSEGRYFEDQLGIQATANVEKKNRSADQLSASYLIGRADETTGVIPIDINTASIQKRVETRRRWGASLILDYGLADTKLTLGNFYDNTDRAIIDRYHEYSNDRGTTRAAVTDQGSQQGILTNMLRVESTILDFETDATISHGYAKNELPGFYQLVFEEVTNLSKIDRRQNPTDFLRSLPVDSMAQLRESTMRSQLTTERTLGFNINFKRAFDFGSQLSGYFKFGGKYRTIVRKNDRTEGLWPSYLEQQKYYARDFLDQSYDPGKILNGLTALGLVLDPSRNKSLYASYQGKYVVDDFWGNDDRYSTDERIGAGYLMAKINFGRLLTIVPGVRMETVNNSYTGYIRLQYGATWPNHTGDYHDTTTTQKYTDLFPMLHVKVSPFDWFDVRFAVTRTLSRPDFWDMVPYMATSTNPDAAISKGNPDLKPARSWNYDLYASFNSNTMGLFTIGGFYKQVDDFTIQVRKPITQAIADQFRILPHLGAVLNVPINVPQSTIKGFEADLQTNLAYVEFLPKVLRGIVLNVNYTRLFSETLLPYYNKYLISLRPIKYFSFDSLRTGRVPSQANELLNFSVGYDIGGFSARASMHYQTESLDNVGVITENDTYTDAFTRWDISMRQEVTKAIKLYLNFVNITNNPDGSYQFNPDKPSSIQYYGMTVDFGIQWEF